MENKIDFENWISNLPKCCHDIPLNCLSIPGSHNSFTFNLDTSDQLASDAEDGIRTLVQMFGPLAKSIVHSWSTNQSMSVSNQLAAGIRYFDIRVATKAGTQQHYSVHALHGPLIECCLDDLKTFLDGHSKEIVILDFNHFYDMDDASHARLIESIISRFSSKMCPVMDVSDVTLSLLWDTGVQLIVFYHHPVVSQHFQLWPGGLIPGPWHNKTSISDLMCAVPVALRDRTVNHVMKFHVTQGILTPDNSFIFKNLASSLKTSMAAKVARPFVDWVRQQKPGVGGINIVTIDFVEMSDFIATVINLNFSLS